ncbi:50S ribosomal protein L2 [Candidatus Woesearchaeota archaeon]|nr:50S ribosomal protein L2 [Candidatus Woesearchaeota archaeon]
MGKNLIQQARGKGGPRYRSPSFRFKGKAKYGKFQPDRMLSLMVKDIVHCPGHYAPLLAVEYEDGTQGYVIAPDGMRSGEKLSMGADATMSAGNILPLKAIPEGTAVYNIESNPGDGGKFVRCPGTFAKIKARFDDKVVIELPSKKEKDFHPECRASIGEVAGFGRKDKPFFKAGNMFYRKRARNKLWPKVCGVSMNAVDHPFGGKSSHVKGRPTQAPRSAPPGRKVGKIAPKRTGLRKA